MTKINKFSVSFVVHARRVVKESQGTLPNKPLRHSTIAQEEEFQVPACDPAREVQNEKSFLEMFQRESEELAILKVRYYVCARWVHYRPVGNCRRIPC